MWLFTAAKGLREVHATKKCPPGSYVSQDGQRWETLRLIPRQATRKLDWVSVSKDQLPKRLRTAMLLLGLT